MREDIIEILRENWGHSYNDCADDLEDLIQQKIEKIAEEAKEMSSFLSQFYYRSMSNGLVDIDTDERERIKKLLKIK